MGFIEYTNVTLKMIIDSGLIEPDTKIYSSSQPEIIGNVKEDGTITLFIDNQDKVFYSPSGAARAVVNLSVNGWTFWKLLIDNKYLELSSLRELYNSKLKKGAI